MRSPLPRLAATSLLLTAGCGATSLRVSASPTLDTGARVGFEATLSAGVGWPLDWSGRSHYFVQGRAAVGGGLDGRSGKPVVTTGGELDIIHWAEPKADVRAGLHALYRHLGDAQSFRKDIEGGAVGGHVGVYPIVLGNDSGWAVQHFLLGPELRAEYVWTGSPADSRAIVSLPLVAEFIFLATGD